MAEEIDLQAKLDAARAERGKRDAARAIKQAQAQLESELALEERIAREDEAVERLESEHGPLDKAIRRVDTPGGMVVVKKPNHVAYKKFVDKGKTNFEELDKLLRPCLVYPPEADFYRLVQEFPHAHMQTADAICWLAGVRKAELGER